MAFDVAKLKELNELDPEQIAIWPREIKIVVAIFLAIVIGALGYMVLVKEKLPKLEMVHKKEQELRSSYEAKYAIAANMEAYQAQLERLRTDFATMLKSLPTSNETPGLLDDITFTGTANGLTFKLIQWQQEVPKEFYAELPIQIEVTGQYHQFGQFLAGIAALPRIVTVHDFDVEKSSEDLILKLQAKTYRTDHSKHSSELSEAAQ